MAVNSGPLLATREGYGRALVELGHRDERVVVLDADLSKSTQTAGFAREFPARFFNAGVAEANLIGMAAGLAASGFIPFASTFAIFATQRALNQIFQSVAYPGLNVKIAASHAGITVGEDGASHQAVDDLALLRAMPGMTVVVPADAYEAYQATFAVAAWEGPVYLRLGRPAAPVVTPPEKPFAIGRITVLREGDDVTICACGLMVGVALAAAEKLSAEGIQAAVLNVSTLKPLDTETLLAYAARSRAVVTVEEHSIIGGLGGAVCEALAATMPVPVVRMGISDSFGQSGKPAELLAHYGLTAQDVAQAVKKAIERKEKKNG
ncbi:transketolase subunit B [Thermodesulfitimonas autotrophica]|uniref:Transketolase subunit B n=1 Tax=Thermodesulfitimonas autotrophica TaxID=1894989 RepID=A0A3N5ANR7_9THEO|nr:transketolase family protein [Thermodesulfitimonas autotrophica]RPF46836.1 transketolase subunit B [Thermodesulfitimonas autotrophica]